MVEVERRASEAEGPFSRREEGWELGEKESKSKSKRVEIQPAHRSGMGLRAIKPKQGDGGIYTNSVMLGFCR